MLSKTFDKLRKLNSGKFNLWVLYSLAFGVSTYFVFSFFALSGSSMINKVDGLNQNFVSLLYFRRWELNLFKNGFHLWDANIGFGENILSTVFYYLGITPITCLAFLIPENRLEMLYAADTIFRLYMVGLAFCVYSKSKKHNNLEIVLGSLAYAFCGFALQKGFQHVFFLIPMIYFPIMCWSTDRILKKKSVVPFVISTALCAVTSFYFFYMTVIGIVLYVLTQLFFNKSYAYKEKCVWLVRFLAIGTISVMLSGIVLFPMIYQMRGGSRVGNAEIPAFYSLRYYCELFFGFMTNRFRDFDSRTGYTPTIVLSIIVLMCNPEGSKKVKIAFAGLTAMLCFPLAGSVMNGFGYISNRWIFIYSFLLAYILTSNFKYICKMNTSQLIKCCGIFVIYLSLAIVAQMMGIFEDSDSYRTVIILLVAFLCCMAFKERIRVWVISIVTIVGMLYNIYAELSPTRTSAIGGYVSKGNAIGTYTEGLISNNIPKDDSDFDQYRSITNDAHNANMIAGIKGENFYFSVVDGSINKLMNSLEINNPLEHQYTGFDDRIIPESITGVKYKCYDGELSTNDYALPIAFSYFGEMSEDKYNLLSVEEKQEALLYNAVVENPALEEQYYETETKILYEGELTQQIKDTNQVIKIPIDGDISDSEVYLIAEGISYKGMLPSKQYAEDWDNADYYTKSIVKVSDRTYQESDSVTFTLTCGEKEKAITYNTPKNRMYVGREDFLCNLGCFEDNEENVNIRFSQPGEYHISNLKVVAMPMDSIYSQLKILNENDHMDISFGKDCFEGNIVSTKKEILCISVPYSEGWTAYVDGMETEIKRANVAFMSVELEEGQHSIVFSYELPLLKVGCISSVWGIILLIAWELLRRRNENSLHSTAVSH